MEVCGRPPIWWGWLRRRGTRSHKTAALPAPYFSDFFGLRCPCGGFVVSTGVIGEYPRLPPPLGVPPLVLPSLPPAA